MTFPVLRVTGAAFAACAFLATPGAASAQTAGVCKGKIFIDSVYQNGLGGNQYEYNVQIRNGTQAPLRWTLTFRNFPKTVSVFSPQLSGGPLAANGSETLKFGKGTDGNVSGGTVAYGYDTAPGGAKPSITLSGCAS